MVARMVRWSRARTALVVVAVALLVHAVVYDTSAEIWLYVAISGTAALIATQGARRPGAFPGAALVALGLGLNFAGDVLWTAWDLLWGAPDVSPADVPYLASYGALAVGLWRLAGARGRSRREQVDGWIDGVIVLVAALLVVWQLSVAATVADDSVPLLTRSVWAAYPALDATLIALVFRLVSSRARGDRTALAVAAGAACWLGSDLGTLLVADADVSSVWFDTGWLLGGLLLAAATVLPRGPVRAAGVAAADDEAATGLGRLAVCLGALLVPTGLDVLRGLTGARGDSPALTVGAVVLTALVFLRTARLLRAEAAARALVRSQQRHSAALAAHSSDAVVVLDRRGLLLSEPVGLARLLGELPHGRLTTADLLRLSGVDEAEARRVFQRAVAAAGAVVDVELRGGPHRWLGARLADLTADPDVRGVVLHVTDITDRKDAEAALAHQAFHDGLTGLANRALFTDRVEQALHRAARLGGAAAVVFLDLDVFKAVNDSLGHQAGDALLREVAVRLRSGVRAEDTVARLGGDEFAVLVEQAGEGPEEAEATARRLLEALARPVVLEGRTLAVSASVGVAVGTAEATADSLIRDADIAMYAAKTTGRGRYLLFDPAMRAAAVARRDLEQELRGALAGGEFRLVYQPVVRLADDRPVGVEALLRWHSPVLGTVPPDRFVPVAEDLGLIGEIGAWVLREACATAAAWRAMPGAEGLTMAVNVSAVQITSPDLLDQVGAALRESGLPPSALVVEVTETALVEDPERAAHGLAALRALGVRLALDDFGTGYSSLGYLRQFTVDVLKIDRSFVATIGAGGELPAIVRGIIDLGRTLDLEIVAEGVEDDGQRRLLRAARCDLGQGYLFARPLERADAERWLAERTSVVGTLAGIAGPLG
jgi:diguanylate cyclase (GGDEF)-like protein